MAKCYFARNIKTPYTATYDYRYLVLRERPYTNYDNGGQFTIGKGSDGQWEAPQYGYDGRTATGATRTPIWRKNGTNGTNRTATIIPPPL